MDNLAPQQRGKIRDTSRQADPMVMRDGKVISAKEYKPTHGGYPGPTNPVTGSEWGPGIALDQGFLDGQARKVQSRANGDDAQIAAEIVASESPRKSGFNYGSGWGSEPKPSIYFDAVRLSQALDARAHAATAQAWKITTAIRAVRLAETETEKRVAVSHLTDEVASVMDSEEAASLRVYMLVNDLANQIDVVAPPNPKGYVPHMGIHYAMKPLRDTIAKLREWFKTVPG